MRTMKPLETQYKGYRFRSRLEARWAVFFDALGLDWEYEPEGFDLGEAGWYLPDFKVKYPGRDKSERHNEWFEVKGDISHISLEECKKIARFADHDTITILDGVPTPTMYTRLGPGCAVACSFSPETTTGKELKSELKSLSDTPIKRRFGWALWSESKGRMWWDEHENYFCPTSGFGCENSIEYACDKARAARFEHGETPC